VSEYKLREEYELQKRQKLHQFQMLTNEESDGSAKDDEEQEMNYQ